MYIMKYECRFHVHRLTSLDGSPLPVAKLTPLVMSPPKKGNTLNNCDLIVLAELLTDRITNDRWIQRFGIGSDCPQRKRDATDDSQHHCRQSGQINPAGLSPLFFFSFCLPVILRYHFCCLTHFLASIDPRLAYGFGNDAETASGHRWR